MPEIVTCPSCNTTLKPKTPVPAGTRIKCPKCQTVFAVPGEGEGAAISAPSPAAQPRAAEQREGPDDFAAMGGEAGDAGPTAGRGAGAPKKGGVPLWVWLVGGGAVLLLVCCGVCGGIGYWGYNTAATAGSGSVTLLNYAQIQKGMSEAQVKTLLGEPSAKTDQGATKTRTWTDGGNTITVTFTNDKATDRVCHLSTKGGMKIDQSGFTNP